MRLHQDIDDLDRMVDGNSAKDEIRSQIRLVAREVASLEADYTRLAQAHSNLIKEHEELKATHLELQNSKKAESSAGMKATFKKYQDVYKQPEPPRE
jgi:chromosome segregation ATPase